MLILHENKQKKITNTAKLSEMNNTEVWDKERHLLNPPVSISILSTITNAI